MSPGAASGGRIVFRVDASVQIGTGHVMRCLTLAAALRAQGGECHFLSRALPGNLIATIAGRGFAVTALDPPEENAGNPDSAIPHAAWLGLPWQRDATETRTVLAEQGKPDWLILDHYALDRSWQAALPLGGVRTLVIDDVADRPLDANIVLNQNYGASADCYSGTVRGSPVYLCGSDYALLKPEFAALREAAVAARERRLEKKDVRLLISLGGVDQHNLSGAILDALAQRAPAAAWQVDVVLGSEAPHRAAVADQIAGLEAVTLHIATDQMPELMAEADLCIGAAGTTSWERCTLGLPTILVELAANQRDIAQALSQAGAALLVDADPHHVADATVALAADPNARRALSTRAATICDGRGTERVIAAMNGL